MKFITFILINCAYQVTSSKLPLQLAPDNENNDAVTSQLNTDSLNTRDIGSNYYESYMPADYGNLYFVSDWLRNFVQTFTAPVHDTTAYYPIATDYSQEQWSSPYSPHDWNQYGHNNPDPNRYDYPNSGEHATPYYVDQYKPQPTVTTKFSTVLNTEDSKEIKHKVIISPEHPNGTGYISIGKNGSGDGKVYYRY